jgi:membrane protein involved in colicin uptake
MINRWTRVALAGVLAATLSMPMIAQGPTAPAVQEKTKAEKEAEKKAAAELKKANEAKYMAAAKAAKEKAEADKKAAEASDDSKNSSSHAN